MQHGHALIDAADGEHDQTESDRGQHGGDEPFGFPERRGHDIKAD